MDIKIFHNRSEMGARAANDGAAFIRRAIAERGSANIILATGASQFEMLAQLVVESEINWPCVTVFHLDEYLGLPMSHPASFRRYLWERFASKVSLPVRAFYYLDGEGDVEAECLRAGNALREHPVDVAFVGIGENGHLAFNDPPADFNAQEPYFVVDLDDECRQQQLHEGWFPTIDDVPKRAITMSVSQILKSAAIVCTVPGMRKATAVRAALEGEISPQVPASVLQRHLQAAIYLDDAAASLLSVESKEVADQVN